MRGVNENVLDPEGRVLAALEESVLDPEGRVLCCALGFDESVLDPEGRVLVAIEESVLDPEGRVISDVHLQDRRGILVSVSCWELIQHTVNDDGRETGCFDGSHESLQLPHDNGSLLELVDQKNFRSPSNATQRNGRLRKKFKCNATKWEEWVFSM